MSELEWERSCLQSGPFQYDCTLIVHYMFWKRLNSPFTINCKVLVQISINYTYYCLLCSRFVSAMREAEFNSKMEAANHLLLFVSALVPKALASILTSFCLELAKEHNVGIPSYLISVHGNTSYPLDSPSITHCHCYCIE